MKAEDKQSSEQTSTVKRTILRINLQNGSAERVEDEVAVEKRVELYINDELSTVFSCSPSRVRELVVGHLLAEGEISGLNEIAHLEISQGRAHVRLRESARVPTQQQQKGEKAEQASGLRLGPQTVLRAAELLSSRAVVFRSTGGTHASAILDEAGNLLSFSEDIGRHNAVDKAIGEAALKDVAFEKTMLVSTGRLASEIVAKVAHVEVPIVISVSAPTDEGIRVAEEAGLTLIGFARGGRFNIYTHPERIRGQTHISGKVTQYG